MNNYKYDTFTIYTYHDIDEAKNKNEDIDFYVKYNGRTYLGTAVTCNSVKENMAKNKITDEECKRWYWSVNFIIIEDMNIECLSEAVFEIIQKHDIGIILYEVPTK